MFLYYCILLKGPSIKDVRKGGGEGVGPKADKIGHGEGGLTAVRTSAAKFNIML